MNTWTPLWSGIVDSSLWEESGEVVKVFMTMLAAKDSDHICRLDAYRIGKKCHIPEVQVLEILKILASPDTRRIGPQEHEGRRIKAVEDGWFLLNGKKYRDMVAEEMRKARLRRAQATFREKQKNGSDSQAPTQTQKPITEATQIPVELQTPAFQKAWGEWLIHLKEKKTRTTASAFRAQLEKCKVMGEEEAIASINRSIVGSYQSIFEKNSKPGKPTGHVSAC